VNFLGPPASPWEGWLIVNETLIFNIWSSYSDLFMTNGEENMKLAAQRWKDWFGGTLQAGPFNTHCIGHGTLQNWCLSQQPSPWTQPLPTCGTGNDSASGTRGSTAATIDSTGGTIGNTEPQEQEQDGGTVTGGGIVSDASQYSDFSNTTLSPYQKNVITIVVVVGVVLLLAVLGFFGYRCYKKKRTGTSAASREEADTPSSLIASAKNVDGAMNDSTSEMAIEAGSVEEQDDPTKSSS